MSKKNCKCPTPGKLVFKSRGAAYRHYDNRRNNVSIYECKCGCYHATRKKY